MYPVTLGDVLAFHERLTVYKGAGPPVPWSVAAAELEASLANETPAEATPLASATPRVPPLPAATMTVHPESSFTAQAAKLPDALQTAIERDLKITPVEYLAQAAAAQNGADVLAGLAKQGDAAASGPIPYPRSR